MSRIGRNKFGFDDVIAVGNRRRKLPSSEESTAQARGNRKFSRVWRGYFKVHERMSAYDKPRSFALP